MRRWAPALAWAAAVAVTWCFVAAGAGENFYIEGTEEAIRQAEHGQHVAAGASLVLLALGVVVPFLGTRFPRAGSGLVIGAASVVMLSAGSEAVLFTGLLSALPVGLGVILALVPARS